MRYPEEYIAEYLQDQEGAIPDPLPRGSKLICPDCDGNGKYIGLNEMSECKLCRGTGVYVPDEEIPF